MAAFIFVAKTEDGTGHIDHQLWRLNISGADCKQTFLSRAEALRRAASASCRGSPRAGNRAAQNLYRAFDYAIVKLRVQQRRRRFSDLKSLI